MDALSLTDELKRLYDIVKTPYTGDMSRDNADFRHWVGQVNKARVDIINHIPQILLLLSDKDL